MRGNNLIWIAAVVVLVLGGFLLFGGSQTTQEPGTTGIGGGPGVVTAPNKIEINLDPVNKDQFDQSGKAALEENNGTVIVTLDVNRVDDLNNQPAHIHAGSCPGVGQVLYPLNDVVDGKSVTEINATIDQLRSSQNPMAINIHKSAQEISVYTACGNLPQ